MALDKGQNGMGRRRTGIIVYGHSRPMLLRNVLESLCRQGVVKDIHVWLDGHARRTGLLGPVNQCRQILKEQFPQVHLTAINGNIGIEKLMLDGLSFMSSRYDRTIVLEDDCFPTACAIEEFKKALDEIEKRPDVYSVYGHHFLTESEGETITRFQGWGWATTRKKLLPMLAEMKQRFAMSEPDYLRWVRVNLTPEVIRRLDVTPGRNCVPVIASHFCWDGCTCLVTAMRGLVHKRTAKRVIYNCGMGQGSTHFAESDRLGRPPFNMIRPAEVWDYYDDTSQQRARRCEGGQVVYSRPATVGSKDQEPRAGEIAVDGFKFTDVRRTKYQNNSVGFSDRYLIKIEHEKHPRKLRDLSQEIEIIKYLNSRGCVSCPRLVSEGRLKSGERYFIQQRIHNAREFNVADMVFSILEQKNFGVCEGDLKKENFIFDRDGVCYIIDYDQAFCNQRFISMGNIEYLEGFAQYMVNRWRNYGLTDFYKWGGYNKNEIFSLFKNGSFNLAATSIFKEQITTSTESGIYHSLNTDRLYIEGARDLNPRQDALNTVHFRKGERVLDVGCNMGLLAHYLHDRGCHVTGIDMDPKIIIGAKMVANILGKNIRFACLDVDEAKIEEQYDTICLFSVIHHVKNFRQVTENIARKCSRIILECGLKEHGYKPIEGKWTRTSGWGFNSIEELMCYLETVFTGFRLSKYHGSADRNRHIMTFVKEPAAIGAQVRSELPVKVQQGESAAAERTHESKYLVSAIVSTYNSERFIRGCLEDLENQTIANKLEIIVVNSGSQQNEEAIVKEFQQKYDNIKYIKTQHRESVYQAWNRGIKAASGKYITNANTDDRHTGDALEKMAEALEGNPEKALVYGNQWNVEEINGERIIVGERINGEFSRSRLFSGECPPGSQPMWRKDVHDVFGYFDEAFFVSGDYEFWFRLTQKFDFLYLNELLGERLIGTELVSGANKELLAFENMLIHKCYNYALQTSTMIAHRAISDNPVFSTWPEVRLWKEKVQAKLHSSSVSLDQYITKTQDLRKPGRPRLSIVVVTYNRASQLEDNLRSLKEQTEQDFELILVSNGSGSPDLQKLSEQFKNGFCYVEISRNFGPSFARNVAVTRTKADYIAFLDDDAIAEKDFVRNVISHFKNHDICGLRGKILPKSRRTAEDGPACYDLGDEVIFTACEPSSHSAYRKEALLKVGGFDQDLFGYEGAELSYRIHKSQNERFNCIIYFPDVVVFHNSRERFEQSVEKNLRKAAASKLARRKWPEIEGYLGVVRNYYPANKEAVEKDYGSLLTSSLYLQERYPREAIKWAQKAAQLEPLVIKSCFVLGSLYTQLKMFDKAVPVLERTLTLLSGELHEFYMDNSQGGRENWSNTAECYISAATKLSQCFMQSQEYGKMKTIYSHLLSNPHLQLTPAQRGNFESVLAKFQNVEAVAIGDGMENVPAGAFKDRVAQSASESSDAETVILPLHGPISSYDQVKDRIAEIEGLLSHEDERFLFDVARSLQDHSVIVEIGSFKGRSTSCLAYGCVGTNKKVYSIDIGFRREKILEEVKANLQANDLQDYVVPVAGDSKEIARKWDKKIDFIFIDGSHYYKTVLSDFVGFYPWVRPGGIVAFHDVGAGHTGPTRVWQEKAKRKLHDTGICGGIAFGRKKLDELAAGEQAVGDANVTTVDSIARYHTHDPVLPKRNELEITGSDSKDFEYKFQSGAREEGKEQKVLIVRPDSVSDFMVFTPVLGGLKELYPNSHIAILVQEHIAELAETCPHIDEVVPFDKKAASSDERYLKQIVEQIRGRKFDIALYPSCTRTRLGDWITLRSGAKEKITLKRDVSDIPEDVRPKNDCFYTKLIRLTDPWMLETFKARCFVRGLGLDFGTVLLPNIWLTQKDVDYADSLLNQLQVENPIVICPFAGDTIRQWPIHKWTELISDCRDYPILICGLGKDKEQANELINLTENENIHNLCGRTTLRQLAALLHKSRLCVTLESGTVHIACAVNCPNVVITGGGQFGRFVPYSMASTVVYVPLDCYNCNGECKHAEPLCITQIKVQTVSRAVRETLNGFSKDHLPLMPQIEKSGLNFVQTKTQTGTSGTDSECLVSAIVSTYNSERFLRGCLDDLQRQSIADKLQIIVVNSGSEQNEEAIVKEFQQKYDNIKYIRTEKREGIYSAWNRAVKVARGEFLTNANTDDRHRADALEVMAKTLQANPEIALVYGDYLVTETANATFEQPCAVEVANLPNYSRETLLSKSCIGSQPMWRKSVHDEFGYFDDTLTRAGDWDFWIRISGKYDFKHILEILGVVHHNENDIEYRQKVHSPYERYIVGKRYGTEYLAGTAYYKGDDGPLVSVIMAAHNAENCITEAIESVLIQNYRKFELLVVDSGSTDRTRQIVLGFKDEKLRYLYKENAGLAGAVNEGIRKSRGDYVIKLDPEDILLPEFVVSGLKKFNEYPDTDVVYCDGGVIGPDGKQARTISQDGDENSTNLVRDLFRYGSPIVPFRTCVRKAVFEKVGLYDEQLAVAEDYDMICRFAKAGLKARHLKGPFYLRRMHPDSLCRTSTTEKAKAHISVIKRIIDTFSPDELFPDVDWRKIPQDKIAQHAGCLIGATLIAIAKNYQTTNELINAGLAVEQARTALNECLKIDPGHSQARGLLRDCELLCRALSRTEAVAVC